MSLPEIDCPDTKHIYLPASNNNSRLLNLISQQSIINREIQVNRPFINLKSLTVSNSIDAIDFFFKFESSAPDMDSEDRSSSSRV